MTLHSIFELKKMALRNLARHKVKTLITCAAIMVSVTVYIWMQSWLGGMSVESRRNIVNYEIGAAKLQATAYFDKKDEMPAYESFAGWEAYASALEAAGYNTAPRYTFSGTLYSLSGSAPLAVYAVSPEAEARTLSYTPYIDFGRYIEAGEFGIALGSQTAEKLKVGVPARLNEEELAELVRAAAGGEPQTEEFIRSCYAPVAAKAQFGESKEFAEERAQGQYAVRRDLSETEAARLWEILDGTGRNDVRLSTVIDYKVGVKASGEDDVRHVYQVIDAKVVGTVNSPDPATNFNAAYIPLDVLQGEEGMMLEGHITELLIRDAALGAADLTSNKETKEAIRAALEAGLAAEGGLPPELDVFTWQDYCADYLGYENMESGATKILSFLLFFLALIGISNTMLLAILERGKEIGMMRALGMTDGELVLVYTLEAFFLGCLGAALGIIAGCLLNYPMVKYGLDFSEMIEKMGGNLGYRVAGNFRGMWDIPTIIGAGVAAAVLSALTAIVPTRRALKMRITESLRFE